MRRRRLQFEEIQVAVNASGYDLFVFRDETHDSFLASFVRALQQPRSAVPHLFGKRKYFSTMTIVNIRVAKKNIGVAGGREYAMMSL